MKDKLKIVRDVSDGAEGVEKRDDRDSRDNSETIKALDALNKINVESIVRKYVQKMLKHCSKEERSYLAQRTSEFFAEVFAAFDEREQKKANNQ
jgi:hypothetical protein